MNETALILRSKGLKPTPQRLVIYEMLRQTKAHPTAEQIYEKVRESHPVMSFNTVYKTLETFESAGLVQKFNPGQGHFRYDGNAEPHAHVTCLSCGRVDDIDNLSSEDIARLHKEISRMTQYRLSDRIDLLLYGYCWECQGPGSGAREEQK